MPFPTLYYAGSIFISLVVHGSSFVILTRAMVSRIPVGVVVFFWQGFRADAKLGTLDFEFLSASQPSFCLCWTPQNTTPLKVLRNIRSSFPPVSVESIFYH
ncbi:hypothetical protein BZA05DRAFT_91594 [Tricharina praecox]|uniref:uncharacterized protein n=1 Tax=Tricharina praecox TaxID=43433 RepID=UPI00222008C8|nr:uncharacterized protein BZA05DRAFT_91594 [Tricharina praecox]KAI5848975.1 hypothetical protein BZA05DRAFT_91594 [Tricharina praecox]